MGQERVVRFPNGLVPPWPQVGELLTRCGFPITMRMIDGQLAFPDEQPPDSWTELRVGTPQGMVTLRHESDGVRLVTWGNADAAMLQAWNAVTWAIAQAGGGLVEGSPPDEFRRRADLPSCLRVT